MILHLIHCLCTKKETIYFNKSQFTSMATFIWQNTIPAVMNHMTCYNLNWPKNQVICALSCLFLCLKSSPENLEESIQPCCNIRNILEEFYVAFMWFICQHINKKKQKKTANNLFTAASWSLSLKKKERLTSWF